MNFYVKQEKRGSSNGKSEFYTSNIRLAPEVVKYEKKKFEDHIMLWLCFSEKVSSKPYFLNKGISMSQYNYLKECIQKRVMPFIRQYHAANNYIFWPDQAKALYTKSVINYLNEHNVNFVRKNDNPVIVPECRPIENFWSFLKQQVYKNN